MLSLLSLLEFLVVVVGIATMIGFLCLIVTVVYFLLSVLWFSIKLKFRPEPEPPPPRPAILLSPGAFYSSELPASPRHQMFCLMPYELDADTEFDTFAVSCARQMFRTTSFVVERVKSTLADDDTFRTDTEVFTAGFQQAGGKLFFPDERTLLAVTSPGLPRLYEFMDHLDRYNYYYEIFELRAPLSEPLLSDPKFDLWHSDFTCCMSIYQHHDYVQFETQLPLSSFINPLWEVCRQMERELVLSPKTPKSQSETNAAQS